MRWHGGRSSKPRKQTSASSTTGHTGRGNDEAVRLFQAHSLRTGDYLTDRQRVYRVLEIVPARGNRRAAILEDSHTLDAALFRPRELRRMRL